MMQIKSEPAQTRRTVQTGALGPAMVPAQTARPDFFIVGGPKCGTTAMADYLGSHPQIFMARKEMHFFGSDLQFASHFYRRAEREYLAEFNGWSGQPRIGEASVWYLFSEKAAAEIKAFDPVARIIVMLREPAEMMYSLFRYFRYDGNEPLATFEAALKAEPDRRKGDRLGRQTYFAQGLVYRDAARFTSQLERYFEVFGRERVKVVLLEDLAASPETVCCDVLKFLEVDGARNLPAFQKINAAKAVKSRTVRAVLNDPAVRSAVLTLRPLLPQPVFNLFHRVERVLDRFNSSAQKPSPLEPGLKAELRREFRGEVEKLSGLIDRDLSHWTGENEVAGRCGTVSR